MDASTTLCRNCGKHVPIVNLVLHERRCTGMTSASAPPPQVVDLTASPGLAMGGGRATTPPQSRVVIEVPDALPTANTAIGKEVPISVLSPTAPVTTARRQGGRTPPPPPPAAAATAGGGGGGGGGVPGEGAWDCKFCTLQNPLDQPFCGACLRTMSGEDLASETPPPRGVPQRYQPQAQPRPYTPNQARGGRGGRGGRGRGRGQPSGAAAGGGEEWECPQCTLHNPRRNRRCEVCDADRPGGLGDGDDDGSGDDDGFVMVDHADGQRRMIEDSEWRRWSIYYAQPQYNSTLGAARVLAQDKRAFVPRWVACQGQWLTLGAGCV
jgi:hypothetical protein